jgi:polysaccharide export outer membrane protein
MLTEGDIVEITFPGATNLNTREKIRPDGTISLPLAGDLKVAKKTLEDLQKEVSEIYLKHLQNGEVHVSLDSSAVPIYVTGAVLRPGKIVTDRQLTALEAIMEAGGFIQEKANLKKVMVIRQVEGKRVSTAVNLESCVKGGACNDSILQPNDMIYVPEKVQIF